MSCLELPVIIAQEAEVSRALLGVILGGHWVVVVGGSSGGSILYQLNQFVGHGSQAFSIWWKVTEVTAKITKNLKKRSKNGKFSYKLPSKFPNIVIRQNQNFVRQVTGHTGWWIDLIATVGGGEGDDDRDDDGGGDNGGGDVVTWQALG